MLMDKIAKPPVERLLRGISTDDVETVRDAWRDLLALGDASVIAVQEKLQSSAWSENPRGPLARYLGVLLSALAELDADAFAQEIKGLQKSDVHPFHRKIIEVLSQRQDDEPATILISGVPVFISAEITDRSVVIGNLERWSKTRGLSLENVTRIDVIARHPQMDYLGLYNIFFSGIVLTWPSDTARGPRHWFRGIDAEFTFYHEIGHHVMGHLEGGSVREQEQEADEYTRSMMRSARPVLTSAARLLLWPLKPLIKRVLRNHRLN